VQTTPTSKESSSPIYMTHYTVSLYNNSRRQCEVFNIVTAASDEVTSWTESWLECRSWHIWFILLEY